MPGKVTLVDTPAWMALSMFRDSNRAEIGVAFVGVRFLRESNQSIDTFKGCP